MNICYTILILGPLQVASMGCGHLNGAHLLTISSITKPYMLVEPGYEKNQSSYHKESNTYEVKNLSSGLVIDLMEILSAVCNFTYEVHIREDKRFGDIIEVSNGTVAFTAFIQQLLGSKGN